MTFLPLLILTLSVTLFPQSTLAALPTIKLGILLPFSASRQAAQEQSLRGLDAIRLALKFPNELNTPLASPWNPASLGFTFDVVVRDSASGSNVSTIVLSHRNLTLPDLMYPNEVRATNVLQAAQSIVSTLDLISNKVVAIIGDLATDTTAIQALVSSRLGIPQCSFASSGGLLFNKTLYPHFFRTITTHTMILKGLRAIMDGVGWKKIIVITPLDQFGSLVSMALPNILTDHEYRILPFYDNTTPDPIIEVLRKLTDMNERVVFLAAIGDTQRRFLQVLDQLSDTYLIGQHQWIFLNKISDVLDSIPNVKHVSRFQRTLALGPPSFALSKQFASFVQLWNATYKDLPSSHDLKSPFNQNEITAYICAHVLMRSIMNLVRNSTDPKHTVDLLSQGIYPNDKPFNIDDINHLEFNGPFGTFNLDENGDPGTGVELMYWRTGSSEMDRVATSFDLDPSLDLMKGVVLEFANGMTTFSDATGLPDITIEYNSTPNVAVLSLCFFALMGCVVLMSVIAWNRNKPSIRAISPIFCVVMILGLACVYLAIAFQLMVGTLAWCNVTPSLLLLGLSLVLGNLIAKNHRIWQLFDKPVTYRDGLTDAFIMRISVAVVLVNAVLTAAWLGVSPFRPVTVSTGSAQYRTCLSVSPLLAATIVDLKDVPYLFQSLPFILVCLFNGLLLVYAVVLAWNTRKIPVKKFSESKAISASIYNIFLGVAILLPTFFPPLNGLYSVTYGLRSAVLLFCTTFAMIVFFIPPIYGLWAYQGPQHNHLPQATSSDVTFSSIKFNYSNAYVKASPPVTPVPLDSLHDPPPGSSRALAQCTATAIFPQRTELSTTTLRRRASGTPTPKITQRPVPVQDTYEGTLVMRRTSSVWFKFMSVIHGFWARWRIVHVTLVPHRQMITVSEQQLGLDSPPVLSSFMYLEVRSPTDLARAVTESETRALASRVLPSPSMYALNSPSDPQTHINPCQFVVCSAHHEYTFESETPEETALWVSVLKQALNTRPPDQISVPNST